MTIRREVLHGAPIPPWHRIAYRDCAQLCAVAYPIGLHLVMRFFRRVWEWSYRYKPSRLERQFRKARRDSYFVGYDHGHGVGYDAGHGVGYCAGYDTGYPAGRFDMLYELTGEGDVDPR